jgi:hypothetical protein
MATVSEIASRVQLRVIDLPPAITSETVPMIRRAHRDLQQSANFPPMRGELTLTTTAFSPLLGTVGVEELKAWRDKPYTTDDLGLTRFLEIVHSEEPVRRAYNMEPALGFGRPRNILVKTGSPGDLTAQLQLEAYPIPDGTNISATGEYTIIVPYWRYLPLPASDAADWFTTHAEEYLVDRATAELFALNWDEQRSLFWRQQSEALRARLIRENARFYSSSGDTLSIYKSGRAARTQL